jgi:hypothetical protein
MPNKEACPIISLPVHRVIDWRKFSGRQYSPELLTPLNFTAIVSLCFEVNARRDFAGIEPDGIVVSAVKAWCVFMIHSLFT